MNTSGDHPVVSNVSHCRPTVIKSAERKRIVTYYVTKRWAPKRRIRSVCHVLSDKPGEPVLDFLPGIRGNTA
jgi:hypothetical protein